MWSACSAQASMVGKIGTHGSCGSTGVGRRWRYRPPCSSIGSVTLDARDDAVVTRLADEVTGVACGHVPRACRRGSRTRPRVNV